jgi:hypothetical protein
MAARQRDSAVRQGNSGARPGAARQDEKAAQLVAGPVKVPRGPGASEISPEAPAAAPPVANGRMHEADEATAALAYALWAERGYQDGYDLDDWLEAERRLRGVDGPQGTSSGFNADVPRAR